MARHIVCVTQKIRDECLKLLRECFEVKVWNREDTIPKKELLNFVAGASGILCTIGDAIDKDVLDSAGTQLKVISSISSDDNHIDTLECQKRSIAVITSTDIVSDSAAEFTCALLLFTARRLSEGIDAVINGEWDPQQPMWICGTEMVDKTLGILGFGRVGFGVARRMKPFNVGKIIYHDMFRAGYADTVGAKLVTLEELLQQSDILCICCAVTPQTSKLFDKKSFDMMKPGSILINTTRAEIVDHDALAEALEEGRPALAGLDVTDPEPLPLDHRLMNNTKCIITPHLGTATNETRLNMAIQAIKNLLMTLKDHPCTQCSKKTYGYKRL